MIKDKLAAGFQNLIERAGTQVSIKYYTKSIGSVWDDASLSLSGTLNTSGIILPLSNFRGNGDYVLVEQGILKDDDQKLFLNGSTVLGTEPVKFNIGSYSYTTAANNLTPEVQGQKIYKRQYIRRLTGSLIGE